MVVFLYVGIAQGVLLASVLFLRSIKTQNNSWYLGVFILALSGIISRPLLTDYISVEAGLLVDPLVFLLGPMVYLFIRSFVHKNEFKDLLLHTIPFLLYIPVLALFYFLYLGSGFSNQFQVNVFNSTFAKLISLSKFIHLLVYWFFSFKILRTHRRVINDVFSDPTGKNLRWVSALLWGFLLLTLVSIVLYFLAIKVPSNQSAITIINLALISIYLYILSFFGFRQEPILNTTLSEVNLKKKTINDHAANPKYQKSGLKLKEIQSLESKLRKLLTEDYVKNPDLTLLHLAKDLETQPHKLSEFLNKHLKISFYDLVNKRRIDNIRGMIRDPKNDHLTFLGLAFENGYNSKSAFNTAFKKYTGTTPSAYKRSLS